MDEDKVFNVFISHKVDDRSIALKLQEALDDLCGKNTGRLKVFVCEDTPGGAKWREWITDNIASSTALIFLYTDIDADWSWCQFEIGSFIGRVKPGKTRPVLCLKNSTIRELPSTIAGFQAYNADIEGIKKLFEELLNSEDILSERLNPDLGKNEERFSKYVKDIVTQFTVTTKTNFFDRRIDIILREGTDSESSELEIGDARISVDQDTMSLLDLPRQIVQNVRWKDLATSFKDRGQGKWTDQLEESVKRIENGQKPLEVLNPFKGGDGNAYIPVIARIETLQRRDEKRTITTKLLRVIFVPSPKSEAMPTLAEFFKPWHTYTPASVLRLKWRGQSGESEYHEDDLEEEPAVCAINEPCARLFDCDPKYISSKKRLTTLEQLVEGIRDYVSEENMKMLEDDQEKVFRRIVYKNKNAVPRVPFQFNDAHPEDEYKNQVYLPLLIGKQVIGDESGPHETYLLIGYIKDFLPPGESAQT